MAMRGHSPLFAISRLFQLDLLGFVAFLPLLGWFFECTGDFAGEIAAGRRANPIAQGEAKDLFRRAAGIFCGGLDEAGVFGRESKDKVLKVRRFHGGHLLRG